MLPHSLSTGCRGGLGALPASSWVSRERVCPLSISVHRQTTRWCQEHLPASTLRSGKPPWISPGHPGTEYPRVGGMQGARYRLERDISLSPSSAGREGQEEREAGEAGVEEEDNGEAGAGGRGGCRSRMLLGSCQGVTKRASEGIPEGVGVSRVGLRLHSGLKGFSWHRAMGLSWSHWVLSPSVPNTGRKKQTRGLMVRGDPRPCGRGISCR